LPVADGHVWDKHTVCACMDQGKMTVFPVPLASLCSLVQMFTRHILITMCNVHFILALHRSCHRALVISSSCRSRYNSVMWQFSNYRTSCMQLYSTWSSCSSRARHKPCRPTSLLSTCLVIACKASKTATSTACPLQASQLASRAATVY